MGGLAEHVRCLAIGAEQVGVAMTVCTDAVIDTMAWPASCQVRELPLNTGEGIRALAPLVADADTALLLNAPTTTTAIPLLARAGRAAIGVHGTPGGNSAWLGTRRHALVVGSLQALPDLPLLIPAERDRDGIAEEFGVDVTRVNALPNAVEKATARTGPIIPGLGLASRFSGEKSWQLEAAIDAANRSHLPLLVVGAGATVEQWRETLRRSCQQSWTLIEDADIDAHVGRVEIVVGTGLIAMEAAVRGQRVIVPGKSGGWVGAVTSESFDLMRACNFVGWHQPPVDARTAVGQAQAVTDDELRAIAERLRTEASPAALVEQLLALASPSTRQRPLELTAAITDILADHEQTESKIYADYAELAEHRDAHRAQAQHWEAAYRDAVEAATPDPGPQATEPQVAAPQSSEPPWAAVARRAYTGGSLVGHAVAGGGYLLKKQRRLMMRTPARTAPIFVRRTTEIPRAAWVAVTRGAGWEVTAGEAVEVAEHGVFEGVFTGDFGALRPDRAETVFGTGLVMTPSGPVFVPSHFSGTPLFAVTGDGRTVVSNSVVFALVAAGLDDDVVTELVRQLRANADPALELGVERMPTRMATSHGHTLHMVNQVPFSVRPDGAVVRYWRPPLRHVRSYAQYVEFLDRTISALFSNGQDHRRTNRLRPLASVSSGYDSVASAVLAARAGCRDAFTIDVTVEGRHDSGEQIARMLGMDVTPSRHFLGDDLTAHDLNAVRPLPPAAAEFVVPTGTTVNMVFIPLAEHVRDSMLVTGAGGDAYWDKAAVPSPGLAALGPGMRGDTEFRLRVGYAHIPVPCIAARFPPDLVALSNSAEMRPFSVGGAYDRPVPRRIAEEAGIPRESFGRVKTAVGPLMAYQPFELDAAVLDMASRYGKWQAEA